jgi:hypothetical protein
MTTHETDRPADDDSVAPDADDVETEARRADEPDTGSGDPDVADDDTGGADGYEPELVATDEADELADDDTGGADGYEPELVATDEADEPAAPEPADEPDRTDAGGVVRTPEADPVQRVAPVGPDTAIDPGAGSYQDRWGAIQAGFIDDPGRTVESASALVAEIWDEIERSITDEREGVESRWRSTDSSTDDLRAVMQDYRDLYDRFMHFTPQLTAEK